MTQQAEELTVNLAVRVAPSMLEELRQAAAAQDRPVTWMVRKFIATGLSAEKELSPEDSAALVAEFKRTIR